MAITGIVQAVLKVSRKKPIQVALLRSLADRREEVGDKANAEELRQAAAVMEKAVSVEAGLEMLKEE